MKYLNKYLIAITSIIILSSCSKHFVEYKITIVSESNLVKSKDDLLPTEIKTFMQINPCSQKDTVFIPKVSVFREDLKKNKKEITIPTSMGNTIKKKMKTYGIADMQNDYAEHFPTMKAGDFLSKAGNTEKTPYLHTKNSFVFNLGGDSKFKSPIQLKQHIDSLICSNSFNYNKELVIVLKSDEQITTGGDEEEEEEDDDDENTDPCGKPTVGKALALKDDLLRIIDTQKTYTERDKIAKEVWEKYFDKMASIKMYSRPNQKHPDFWESGDGKNYLVDRLAYKSSIVNLNITRVEFHRDTNKISSIIIVECHNASEAI